MIRGNFVHCFFGNPSNVDLANQAPAQSPRNCFFGTPIQPV